MFGLNDSNQKSNDSANGSQPPDPEVMPQNPFNDSSPVPPPAEPTVNPDPTPAPAPPPVMPASPPEPATTPAPNGDELLDLKGKALQSLQPLVSHLDQSPEEKFKTTMMLIQATDNSDLVKQAYEAANQIPDEKARAQALLDVVNEINYFTHKEK